ncbi:MAG: hypothetical protein QM490_05175 [Candidatus Gracilibacteria bacterium]
MIKDYLDILSKKDIELFLSDSPFLENSYLHGLKKKEIDEYTGEKYAFFKTESYYMIDQEEYKKEKLPGNFIKIGDILIKLGAIKTPIRQSTKYEEGFFAIDYIDFNKINLLENILFNQKEREKPLLLDQLNKEIKDQSLRVVTILNILQINDDIINFIDTEIFIHALSIKYPKKIKEVSNLLKINLSKKIKGLKVKGDIIKDIDNNILIKLTPTEQKVVGLLISQNKNGGMNHENIRKNTKQSKGALDKTLKDLRKKWKDIAINHLISIRFSSYDKCYTIDIKGI